MKSRFNTILRMTVGVTVVLLLLAACNLKNTTGAIFKKTEVKLKPVEVWTNNASSKTEDIKMVYDFNKGSGKEKGIMIDYKILGEEYAATLQAAMASDQAPALFKSNSGPFTIPQLAKLGWIVGIEDMPGGKELLKKYDGYLQPITNTFNGKTYTVPFAVTTLAVAYNKELLKKNGYLKPPETWAELRQMAKTITQNGGGKEFGFIEGLKSNIHSQNGLYQFVSSVGHNEFNSKTGKFTFADFKPLYQMWMEMRKDGSVFPGCEGINNDQARAQFAEGNIGFKFSASYDVGVWKDQFPTKMDWGICRPVEDPAKKYKNYTYQTPSLVFGRKALEMPEKSMEVFKLWNAEETLVKLYEAGKYIPYRQEIIKMSRKEPRIKNWQEFADRDNSYVSGPNPHGEIKLEGDTAFSVIQKIITGAVSVDQGLADLDARYNAALEKAVSGGLDLAPYIDEAFDTSIK